MIEKWNDTKNSNYNCALLNQGDNSFRSSPLLLAANVNVNFLTPITIKEYMKKTLCLSALIVLMISCKTYTVTPENFKKQIVDNNANNLKDVKVNNPLTPFSNIEYKANSLKYLNVFDKNGSLSFLQNSPSVEMRVTLKNGKRKIFYLDTVTLENDTLKGEKSRILGLKDKVPFNDIVKIEVQDGGKKYQYE